MVGTPVPSGSQWRKSSLSSGAENCVELAYGTDRSAVRDSKNPAGSTLRLDLASLLGQVKIGRFDR